MVSSIFLNTKIKRRILVVFLLFSFFVPTVSASIIFNDTYLFSGGGNYGSIVSAGTYAGDTCTEVTICKFFINFDNIKLITSVTAPATFSSFSGGTPTLLASADGINQMFVPFSSAIGANYLGSGYIGWIRTTGNNYNYYLVYSNYQSGYASGLSGEHEVTLTYNTTIFTNYATAHFGNIGTYDEPVTYSYVKLKMGVYDNTISRLVVLTGTYNIIYSYNNIYSITINDVGGGFSIFNVSKNSNNARINYTNSTGYSYYNITSVNDVSILLPILQGIIFNLTNIASGDNVLRTFYDSSGNFIYPLPIVPGTGNSPSGQIYFDYSTAALTYPYGINVSLTDANYSGIIKPDLRIRVTDPKGNVVSGFPVDFSKQTYTTSRLWNFEWTGTYNASLYSCNVACMALRVITLGATDGDLVDTATLTIAQTQYNYSVTSDANSYSTGDIIRFNISNPSPQQTYFNMFLQRGTSGGTGEIYDLIVPASSVRYVNVTVTGDMTHGSWEGSLNTKQSSGSALTDKVASKAFSISTPVPGSKVSVQWDSNYILGETNNLYYTTNQNTSTVTVNKTLPGSNASFIFSTFTAYPTDTQPKQYLMDTVGQWIAKIIDNGNASNTSTATITVEGISGCNKNLPDYVCWDKATYLKGDPYVINYKRTPVLSWSSDLRLLIFDPDEILILNKTIEQDPSGAAAGMKSGTFKSAAKAGKWHAILMKGGTKTNNYLDGDSLADSYAIVIDAATSTGGTNVTSVPGTPRAMLDGWASLFGMGINDVSRMLFALLFVTAGMFSGFMLSGKNLYGGVFGAFLPWAFFALPSVNYIPSWVTIFIAIIVALKIGWFK